MKINKITMMTAAILLAGLVNAQDFLGYNYNNYQTAGGMIFNPASIADSRYKVNVNLFSFNVGLMTNAISIDPSSFVSNFDHLKEGRDYSKTTGGGTKNLYVNLDLLAPSFMIDLGKKIGSFGFSTRLRSMSSINNLSSQVFDMIGNSSHSDYLNQRITLDKFRLSMHAFADAGLTYARTVWETDEHLVKAGITGKLILGFGGGSVHIDDLDMKINQDLNSTEDEIFDQFHGKLTAVYSDGIDPLFGGDFDIGTLLDSHMSKSVGLDIGVEYEWYENGRNPKTDAVSDSAAKKKKKRTPYTIKASAAITDIGSIKYTPAEYTGSYIINGENKKVSDLDAPEGNTFSDYLEYLKSEGIVADDQIISKYKMKLPTTLRLNVDWNAYGMFYLNAGTHLNLVGSSRFVAKYPSLVYLTPRMEFGFGAIYSPLSVGGGGFNWGLGFNVGGFFIGSGAAISSIVKSNISAIDIHFGFAVPISK